MSLVDQIEQLGAAVDAGLLDRTTAAHQLAQFSDGGLTLYGAGSMLGQWQTARATYADIGMRAEMGIAACESAIRRRDAA